MASVRNRLVWAHAKRTLCAGALAAFHARGSPDSFGSIARRLRRGERPLAGVDYRCDGMIGNGLKVIVASRAPFVTAP